MTDADPEPPTDNAGDPIAGVGDIVDRLRHPIANPVTRARLRVEQEVPVARRGPGWDRHWRELEAYAEPTGEWPMARKGAGTPD
ncbi:MULTISPECIES: hypothetical protein [Edaphosphingomonas]|uniref:Uncharacterized protein n=1 Tax=Edaphosphingomonas haloaromaticamans TaxID=653954 RepID=A0A1S1HHJ4_9SPHN|nr:MULTISPECIES: hypothetical protein [Sphingomonas]MDX3885046.1 hypothetical protein [Sphingomonas sp.]OHT21302.1 hypothetical protein BHE75_03308 [Sphingomonas haloaromaticamans]